MDRGMRSSGRAFALVGSLLVLAMVLGVAGCEENSALQLEPITVDGTWVVDGLFDWDRDGNDNAERWLIESDTITYQSSLDSSDYTTNYKANIITYSDTGLNAGETEITSGVDATGRNPGFAVVEFTDVANDGWGTVGKYTVFRWADTASDSAAKDFTQGYKDGDPDPTLFPNVVFDTPAEAEEQVTVHNGFFDVPASSGAKKQ